MKDTYDFFEDVAKVVRGEVLEYFNPDSCIATTRIVIDVLQYFGVQAKPLPVEVLIFNALAMEILETEGMDAVAAAVWETPPDVAGGAWTVGLGLVVNDTLAGGHVVASIPAHGMFIDASIDQASRPLKGIHLEPFVVKVGDDPFLTEVGSSFGITATDQTESAAAIYTHSPHKQFENSPNWRRTAANLDDNVFRKITAASIRKLK